MKEEKKDATITGLAAVICGIFMVITVLVLIFDRESSWLLVPIVWAFVVLGIVLGSLQYKLLRDMKDKKK